MTEAVLARIERDHPGLLSALDALPGADLRSLLLAVAERRAARVTPAAVLDAYTSDRFTRPAAVDPLAVAAFEREAFARLAARGYAGVEFSPVAPLGTVSAVSPNPQSRILATMRGTEVVADHTNVLALESAVRRRDRLRADPRSADTVKLYASHRLLRTQALGDDPRLRPHFRLLGFTIAGRDTGSSASEREALYAQVEAMLDVIGIARPLDAVRIAFIDFGAPGVIAACTERLRSAYPQMECTTGTSGRGDYYVDARFRVFVDGAEIGDGGFTTWTRRLLGNAKERLITGALSVERLAEP